jgi:hypothetical protein
MHNLIEIVVNADKSWHAERFDDAEMAVADWKDVEAFGMALETVGRLELTDREACPLVSIIWEGSQILAFQYYDIGENLAVWLLTGADFLGDRTGIRIFAEERQYIERMTEAHWSEFVAAKRVAGAVRLLGN